MIGIEDPLPDVSCHIEDPIRACALGFGAYNAGPTAEALLIDRSGAGWVVVTPRINP